MESLDPKQLMKPINKRTDRLVDGQTDKQTHRQMDRWTGRQTFGEPQITRELETDWTRLTSVPI